MAQTEAQVGNKEVNLAEMRRLTVRASQEKCDFIVFPELSLTGYMCRDEFYLLAEEVPGESTREVANLARETGVSVVFGLPERVNGSLFNTAVYVSPDGFIGTYQKHNLPTHSVFDERRYFRQGTRVPVFETPHGKIGLSVCYDLFFPEITRSLALKGAEVIFCLSASPSMRREYFETFTRARALENGVFVIYVNVAGLQEDLIFWGGSHMVNPAGTILNQLKYDRVDFGIVELDLLDRARVDPFLPMISKDVPQKIKDFFINTY